MISLGMVHDDILSRPCDLLILKHADGFHGIDKIVADKVGFSGSLDKGEHSVLRGRNIEARQVMFLGVGPLEDFRYAEIREFGRRALHLALRSADNPRRICSPVHGPGYGLDEGEAFLSLVAGFSDAIGADLVDKPIEEITIVEHQSQRAALFAALLLEKNIVTHSHDSVVRRAAQRPLGNERISIRENTADQLLPYGRASEAKVRLFVAMPFKSDFSDEWEIAISEASQAAEILCERIDEQAYTGDIITQIKKRISQFDGLIALLNEANPNVFLELGYAWAKDKPTILIAKNGQTLPFDVSGQKCIYYSNIADLRKKLTAELKALKADGLFKNKRSA